MNLRCRQNQSYDGLVDIANLIQIEITEDSSERRIADHLLVAKTRQRVTGSLAHLLLRISDRVLESQSGVARRVVCIVQIQPGALTDSFAHLRESVRGNVSKTANFFELLYRSLFRLDACAPFFSFGRIPARECKQLD